MGFIISNIKKGIQAPIRIAQDILNRPTYYMEGESVYFHHGGQAGGADTPVELSARNFYELSQLKEVCERQSITGETVLELGCGYGRITPWLGEFTGASRIIGIDHNDQSIELAETQYPKEKYNWYSGKAENITRFVDKNSIDVILTWTVLQHLSPDVVSATATGIQNALSKEGFLILAEETEQDNANHVWSRQPIEYDDLFNDLTRVTQEERRLEPTYEEYSSGGQVILYKKDS